jgi:hypothetical protein
MEMNVTTSPRARAWILIQTDDPNAAGESLWNERGLQGGDDYVVVRADVVRANVPNWVYNLVVPVDADSEDRLESIHQDILRVTKARDSVVLRVTFLNPAPPHEAEGFVTAEEYARGTEKERVKVGRQHWSPGFNAWG